MLLAKSRHDNVSVDFLFKDSVPVIVTDISFTRLIFIKIINCRVVCLADWACVSDYNLLDPINTLEKESKGNVLLKTWVTEGGGAIVIV